MGADINPGDLQESIFVFVLRVNLRHQARTRRNHIIHENKNGFFGTQLDSFSNDVDELSNRQIAGNSAEDKLGAVRRGNSQVFLLVDICNVSFVSPFHDAGDSVRIFGPDSVCFGLSFVYASTGQKEAAAYRKDVRL